MTKKRRVPFRGPQHAYVATVRRLPSGHWISSVIDPFKNQVDGASFTETNRKQALDKAKAVRDALRDMSHDYDGDDGKLRGV